MPVMVKLKNSVNVYTYEKGVKIEAHSGTLFVKAAGVNPDNVAVFPMDLVERAETESPKVDKSKA